MPDPLLAWVRRVARSVAFYPLLGLQAGATAVLCLIVGHRLRYDLGMTTLALILVAMVMLGMHREVTKIHALVNSRYEEQVEIVKEQNARIGQLLDALRSANVAVPPTWQGGDVDE